MSHNSPFGDVRKRLEAELAEIDALLDVPTANVGEGACYANHAAESASDIQAQCTDFATRSNLEGRRITVVAALQRLDKGAYGICQQCGGAIDQARLAAWPDASLCIACARAQTKRKV